MNSDDFGSFGDGSDDEYIPYPYNGDIDGYYWD